MLTALCEQTSAQSNSVFLQRLIRSAMVNYAVFYFTLEPCHVPFRLSVWKHLTKDFQEEV